VIGDMAQCIVPHHAVIQGEIEPDGFQPSVHGVALGEETEPRWRLPHASEADLFTAGVLGRWLQLSALAPVPPNAARATPRFEVFKEVEGEVALICATDHFSSGASALADLEATLSDFPPRKVSQQTAGGIRYQISHPPPPSTVPPCFGHGLLHLLRTSSHAEIAASDIGSVRRRTSGSGIKNSSSPAFGSWISGASPSFTIKCCVPGGSESSIDRLVSSARWCVPLRAHHRFQVAVTRGLIGTATPEQVWSLSKADLVLRHTTQDVVVYELRDDLPAWLRAQVSRHLPPSSLFLLLGDHGLPLAWLPSPTLSTLHDSLRRLDALATSRLPPSLVIVQVRSSQALVLPNNSIPHFALQPRVARVVEAFLRQRVAGKRLVPALQVQDHFKVMVHRRDDANFFFDQLREARILVVANFSATFSREKPNRNDFQGDQHQGRHVISAMPARCSAAAPHFPWFLAQHAQTPVEMQRHASVMSSDSGVIRKLAIFGLLIALLQSVDYHCPHHFMVGFHLPHHSVTDDVRVAVLGGVRYYSVNLLVMPPLMIIGLMDAENSIRWWLDRAAAAVAAHNSTHDLFPPECTRERQRLADLVHERSDNLFTNLMMSDCWQKIE